MPKNDPDPSDPLTLHGVVVETEDAGATREMATCFIEEFLRMGHDPERILALFQAREYTGPFAALSALGERAIRTLIQEQMRLRGPRFSRNQEQSEEKDQTSLPVLNS